MSEIRLGITRLLNVDPLPRIKQINKVKLYPPTAGDPGAYVRLALALTRPVRWDLIDKLDDFVGSSERPARTVRAVCRTSAVGVPYCYGFAGRLNGTVELDNQPQYGCARRCTVSGPPPYTPRPSPPGIFTGLIHQ